MRSQRIEDLRVDHDYAQLKGAKYLNMHVGGVPPI